MSAWTFTDADRDFVGRHVTPYLPDKVFDAHAHLFCHAHYPAGAMPPGLIGTPEEIGIAVYREYSDWLYADEMNLAEKHIKLQPVLVGLESLRSLFLAFRRLRLTDKQIEAIFYDNAARLFSL